MKIKFEVSITLKETILYAISGVLTTFVNFSVSYLLYNVCNVNENITNAVAWVAAIVFAFFAAHIFVFKTSKKDVGENISVLNRFIMFAVGRVFTLVVELAATFVFVTKLEADFWIIKVTISALIIILNYLISKFIVFKKKPVQIENTED
ncbi:MAG: GtrA family protein [Lachnospiraceae bacterium]|nr:GtrA family protein [Lachnospiraceae bacterium]